MAIQFDSIGGAEMGTSEKEVAVWLDQVKWEREWTKAFHGSLLHSCTICIGDLQGNSDSSIPETYGNR